MLQCGDTEVASWPLVCGDRIDLDVVDHLARLQLRARRQGCYIWLRDACPALVDVLCFAGLADIVGVGRPLQVVGEAEVGEEAGVQKVVMPDDPVA